MKHLAAHIDTLARDALRRELHLELKPGLVTPTALGSHADMDYRTFEASIAALEGYFADCVMLGARGCALQDIQRRGLQAEQAMFAATQGINTHKGAVFTLGLLAAAAGVRLATGMRLQPVVLGKVVVDFWADAILLPGSTMVAPLPSHGARMKQTLGLPGAREQAAAGFPLLFDVTLLQLQHALEAGRPADEAALHALLATVAELPDTNLAHRGGQAGLDWARAQAGNFMATGGVFAPGWRDALQALCGSFVERRLSPGGSADLLSAAWFLWSLKGLRHAPHRCRRATLIAVNHWQAIEAVAA